MFAALPSKATVVEVGPRDGLQAEPEVVSTEAKIALIQGLAEAGYQHIEITSFVNPRWVPQLADAVEVVRRVRRYPGVTFSALVPNLRGLESALAVDIDEVVIFAAASETFSQKNTNRSVAASLVTYGEVVKAALAAGKRVRSYVSTAWDCPYEGPIASDAVERVVESLLGFGCYQVSLGDTIGSTTPRRVQHLVGQLLRSVGPEAIALHFHDTRGLGMANVVAGLDMGISTFDSSLGGLGGCPYAPGATGNIASEDLLYMLSEMGIETGVDLDRVVGASRAIAAVLGRELPSRYLRARLAQLGRC